MTLNYSCSEKLTRIFDTVQAGVAIMACISFPDVLGSNLGWDKGYPNSFRNFLQSFMSNAWIVP